MSFNSLSNPRQYFSFSERFTCKANFDVKKKKSYLFTAKIQLFYD